MEYLDTVKLSSRIFSCFCCSNFLSYFIIKLAMQAEIFNRILFSAVRVSHCMPVVVSGCCVQCFVLPGKPCLFIWQNVLTKLIKARYFRGFCVHLWPRKPTEHARIADAVSGPCLLCHYSYMVTEQQRAN